MGIALDQVVAPVAEVEQFEEPAGLRQDLVGGMVKVKAGDEAQVFVAGQLFVEEGAIGDIAGAPFALERGAGEIMAADGHRAGRWLQQAGQHLDGGGLAGAVGAEEAVDFAGRNRQADIVDGGEAAEVFAELMKVEHGGSHG